MYEVVGLVAWPVTDVSSKVIVLQLFEELSSHLNLLFDLGDLGEDGNNGSIGKHRQHVPSGL